MGPVQPELTLELAAFVAAARAACPAFDADEAAFARHAARDGGPPPIERAPDLYLAFACAAGSTAALGVLDPILRDVTAGAVARIDRSPAFADEVAQTLREKLLVSSPPKIGEYAGRASLRTWLATCAMRAALNLRRNKGDALSARESLSSGVGPLQHEPELDHLRARYREHFAGAVRDAIADLSARDRGLLRLHLGDGATLEKLAAIYRVGRSTAARWLDAARARLVEGTRDRLCTSLDLSPSEYESLAVLLRSEIDVSLVRLLGDTDGP